MTTTQDHIQRERAAHHSSLERLYAGQKTKSGLKIWRQLRRIEGKAHKLATDYCNGDCDSDQWEAGKAKFTQEIFKVLGRLPDGLFINGDARGYALKLDNEKVTIPEGMHQDWGRYGILAPEIN